MFTNMERKKLLLTVFNTESRNRQTNRDYKDKLMNLNIQHLCRDNKDQGELSLCRTELNWKTDLSEKHETEPKFRVNTKTETGLDRQTLLT